MIGPALRAAREARGLSIEDIKVTTLMMVKQIEDLENDKFEDFSAPVYTRGFIKLYARAVGLDPDPLVAEYMATYGAGNSDNRQPVVPLEMATEAMAENAALAILGAERLSFLTEKGLENLERTQLPGRFERRMYGSRLVVIDTAHTEASAASARKAFMEIASPCPTLIFGLVRGKDALGIARTLLPPFSHVIISRPGTYRKSNPEELWEMARSLFPDKDIRLIEDPDEALGSALSIGSDILITGSFYLAGAMKELRKDNES